MGRGRKGFFKDLTAERLATAMLAIDTDPFAWAAAPKKDDKSIWCQALKLLGLKYPQADHQNIVWTWFHNNRRRHDDEFGLQV